MDCCNYVQPYPVHGHFYHQQQQHNFCYDNTNAYGAGAYGIGGGVGGAPVSDAIEANASRYNRLPPAYPTDYVYNPKEARLRKAMREQSRELSRQTILQTAIASATGNTSVGGPGCVGNGVSGNISPTSATGTTNFLNHPLNCQASIVNGSSVGSATVSSLPGSPSFNAGNRIINPWFPGAHGPTANHLKPILSPRVMTVAQHQQQQQHRTFDKTKEVLRKQAECAAGGTFSAASNSVYPTDFSNHGNPSNLPGHQSSSHETNDYCVIAEFSDGQKWHPYQNGPSPYHSRAGGTLTKMGALHPGMQSTNPHSHPGWNQFCTVPLSTVSRAPRHMVFLQEQQQSQQHCGFQEEMQIPYMQNNKHVDISHRLHPVYSQQEHQTKLQSSVSPLNMSQLREPDKTIEDAPRWETNGSTINSTSERNIGSMLIRARRENDLKINQEQDNEQMRIADCRQLTQSKNREREHQQQQQQQQQQPKQQQQQQQQRYNDESSSPRDTKHKNFASSKQPLPGFHQAFGSTEIGRFSRSEFFANMVGDNVNVSNNKQNLTKNLCHDDRTIDMIDAFSTNDIDDSSLSSNNNPLTDNNNLSNHRLQANNTTLSVNRHDRRDNNLDICNSRIGEIIENREINVNDDNDRTMSFNDSIALGINYYNDARSPGPSVGSAIVGVTTMPRWHSPYVSAIGSEI